MKRAVPRVFEPVVNSNVDSRTARRIANRPNFGLAVNEPVPRTQWLHATRRQKRPGAKGDGEKNPEPYFLTQGGPILLGHAIQVKISLSALPNHAYREETSSTS
jgi:hypothetical protein